MSTATCKRRDRESDHVIVNINSKPNARRWKTDASDSPLANVLVSMSNKVKVSSPLRTAFGAREPLYTVG